MEDYMEMTAQSIIQLLSTAKEDDERLDELGDHISELADNEKTVDEGVIEALFKIHERLKDPDQSLFNALESCAMSPQEKTVRKLARESVKRKLNHCNIQLVGTEHESIEMLKELEKQPKLKKEWREIIKEILQEAEEDQV
jgi:hypothetical protein